MINRKRLENEQSFHDKRFSKHGGLRSGIKKYYSINKIAEEIYYSIISNNCKGKKLLELGCGTGDNLEIFHNFGASVTGIDISIEGINKANQKINDTKLNASYSVMNAEDTDFENNIFDIVVGTGIIHHLDLKTIYLEIPRLLNDNGHAVFIEPLGHNPIINLYRKLTPHIRTPDEHPLKRKDLKLLKKYFHNIEIQYFSLFTLFAVPFRNSFIFNPLFKILYMIDRLFLKIPFVREWGWVAVIHIYKPINNYQ